MVLARSHSLEKAQTKAFSLCFFGQDCCGQLSMVADQNHLSSFSSKVSKGDRCTLNGPSDMEGVMYPRYLGYLGDSWGHFPHLSTCSPSDSVQATRDQLAARDQEQ